MVHTETGRHIKFTRDYRRVRAGSLRRGIHERHGTQPGKLATALEAKTNLPVDVITRLARASAPM